MDVAYFSKLRSDFIRTFYREGRKPFDAIKVAIDAEESPYDEPPPDYDYESGEPAYLTEWLQAEMALNVLGYTALSMLSNSLKIAFQNMERELGFRPTEEFKKKVFAKEGFVVGYRQILSEVVATDWDDCPVDFSILEQVVLARNSTQHTDDVSGFDAYHDAATIKKHPRLHFVSGDKKQVEMEGDVSWFDARIEVSEEDLYRAIDEVDKLVDYIMARETQAYEWRKGRRLEDEDQGEHPF